MSAKTAEEHVEALTAVLVGLIEDLEIVAEMLSEAESECECSTANKRSKLL